LGRRGSPYLCPTRQLARQTRMPTSTVLETKYVKAPIPEKIKKIVAE
jgi:hypothetical protein